MCVGGDSPSSIIYRKPSCICDFQRQAEKAQQSSTDLPLSSSYPFVCSLFSLLLLLHLSSSTPFASLHLKPPLVFPSANLVLRPLRLLLTFPPSSPLIVLNLSHLQSQFVRGGRPSLSLSPPPCPHLYPSCVFIPSLPSPPKKGEERGMTSVKECELSVRSQHGNNSYSAQADLLTSPPSLSLLSCSSYSSSL